jgi:hypothetical protein
MVERSMRMPSFASGNICFKLAAARSTAITARMP